MGEEESDDGHLRLGDVDQPEEHLARHVGRPVRHEEHRHRRHHLQGKDRQPFSQNPPVSSSVQVVNERTVETTY